MNNDKKAIKKLANYEYKYYKVRRSKFSSVEVLQFVGQKVRALSDDFDKNGFMWCRTYGIIKSDVLFNKYDLVKMKKRKPKKPVQLKIEFCF